MNLLKKLLHDLLFLLQFLLIIVYIVLEELIWEQFAKPLFRYLKYLKILERFECFLQKQNRYVILFLFLFLLVIEELMGLITPVVIIKGFILLAAAIYIVKILLAALAFWVLNTQKETLLSFWWFALLYKKVLFFSQWLKSTSVYKQAIKAYTKAKLYLKLEFVSLRNYLRNRFGR